MVSRIPCADDGADHCDGNMTMIFALPIGGIGRCERAAGRPVEVWARGEEAQSQSKETTTFRHIRRRARPRRADDAALSHRTTMTTMTTTTTTTTVLFPGKTMAAAAAAATATATATAKTLSTLVVPSMMRWTTTVPSTTTYPSSKMGRRMTTSSSSSLSLSLQSLEGLGIWDIFVGVDFLGPLGLVFLILSMYITT